MQVITVEGTKLYDVALGSGISDIAASIDALTTGGFVASWREYDAISGQHVLYRQQFAADGVALDINAVEVARGQNIHDDDSSASAVAIEGWYDQESVNYQAIDEFELADGTRLEAAQVQSLVEAMNGFAPSVIAENNVVDHEAYDQTRHVITASWGTV